MQKDDFAHELRQRQHALGQVPAEMIDALSDNALIDSSITCSCCGAKQVTLQQRHVAIFMAKDADGCFNICDQLGRKRP